MNMSDADDDENDDDENDDVDDAFAAAVLVLCQARTRSLTCRTLDMSSVWHSKQTGCTIGLASFDLSITTAQET